MLEYQTLHVLSHVKSLTEDGVDWVDVKAERQTAYNEQVQTAIAGIPVWNHAVNGYYKASSGRVVTQWPFSMTEFREMTEQVEPSDYNVGARPS